MPKKSAKRSTAPKRSESETRQGDTASSELRELFFDELADIYNGEQQLVKALPRMAEAAEASDLREAFELHLEETEGQISRLDEVLEALGETLKKKKCKGMEGLIEEGNEMLEQKEDSTALDAALIASAQKIEHYEIASYGTLCAWAKLLGYSEALELLHETLEEEKAADEKLTTIAEATANLEAEAKS